MSDDLSQSRDALEHMREAWRLLLNENDSGGGRSRELSVTITNLETAILWRQEDLRVKSELGG